MAVLEKIRVKFGLAISIIIGLALLSFIIDPGTLESVMHGLSSKYDVGRIAGRSIQYTEYQADVERHTVISEILSGSGVRNEAQQQQILDAAWQEQLDKYLFIKNAKNAGVTVGKAELLDLTTGGNPSPLVLQSFSGPNGYDPQVLVDFVQNQIPADETGRLQIYWNYLQNNINTQQYYTKYGSLFTSSYYLNNLEKAAMVAYNNSSANIDYISVDYPFEQDSTISVSSAEIKKYYKNHKEFFEQRANRDIEYVVFEVTPSAADIAAANEKLTSVYDEFAATTNMKAFLSRNSDRQLSNYWYKAGELRSINAEVDSYVAEAKSSAPSPIYSDRDNVFYTVRVMDSANISDSVYVKHILLQGANAQAKADSLVGVIKRGGNFSALALQYSLDQNSAADGEMGNIGWMTQSYMIPGFESLITAKVGEPMVINTQYGTHIAVVSKKTAPVLKKQVAILEKAAISSKETFGDYYAQANRFAAIAGKSYEGYKAAVDSLGVYSHRLNINEGTSSYGAIDQAKEVTRWAFGSKAGKASEIITVSNNYFFIVAVTAVHKEGAAPLSDVEQGIRQKLYADKLAEAQKAKIAEKIKGLGSLEEMAAALGATVVNEPAFGFSTLASGFDPALMGAAFATEEGKISGPIAGARASYIVRVNSRSVGSFFTEEDAAAQAMQKTQYSTQMVLPVLSQIFEVKDYRDRFF